MKKNIIPLTLLTIALITGCNSSNSNSITDTGSITSTEGGETTSTSTSSTIDPECEHNFSDWVIVDQPSLTNSGTAKRTCSICGNEEIVTIPNLLDTSVWTKSVYDEATCEYEGMDQYSSIYGDVYISTPKSDHKAGDRFYLKDDLIKFYTLQTKCSVCGTFYGNQYKVTKPTEATLLPIETDYTFEYDSSIKKFKNTNKLVDDSIAIMQYKVAVNGTFKFNYSIDSESGCDKFYVTKNDGGISGVYAISGKQNGGDEGVSFPVEFGDVITFKYEKDSIGVGGSTDTVEIWDIMVDTNESLHLSAVTFDSQGGTFVEPSITTNGQLFFDTPNPTKDGYFFSGWFKDVDCVIPVNSATSLEDNAIIYAGWVSEEDANPLMGTYRGFSFGGYGSDHGVTSSYGSLELVVDFNGNTSGLFTSPITGYDEETKLVSCEYGHIVYNDTIDGFIIYTTLEFGTNSTITILSRNHDLIPSSSLSGMYWLNGNYKTISFPSINGMTSLTVDVTKEKYMWNTYLTDIAGDKIAPKDANSSLGFTLFTQKGNSLGYFASKDNKFVGEDECDGYQGVYTNEDNVLTVNGAGLMSEYEALIDKSTNYNYTLEGNKAANNNVTNSYVYILDKETHTYTREVPATKLHLNMMGVIDDYDMDVVAGTWIDLPTPDSPNWAFDGWYIDEGLTRKIPSTRLKVNGEMTIYAKWVVKHTVTLHRNNGEGNYIIKVKDNTYPEFPTFTYEGYLFMGWYKDDELTSPFTLTDVVTEDMDLYAYWVIEPKFYGDFKGLWLSTGYGSVETGKISSEDGSIDITFSQDGKYTNHDTSTTYYNGKFDSQSFPDENGYLALDKKVTTVVTASSGNTYLLGGYTDFGTDYVPSGVRIFAKTTGTFEINYISSANEHVFVLCTVNGMSDVLYLDSNQNLFIADPIFKDDSENILDFDMVSKCPAVHIYNKDDVEIDIIVKTNSTYSSSDQYRGAYLATLFGLVYDIFIDGVGGLTMLGAGNYNGTYTRQSDNVLKLSFGNRTCLVDVVGHDLIQQLDGYEGTYTGAKGDLILTGWGEGTLDGEDITYVVSGDYITLTTNDGDVTYGIDLVNKTYNADTELSIFSGLTFSGNHKDSYGDSEGIHFIFDKGAIITGTIVFGYISNTNFRTTFTGDYDEITHTLVITLQQDIYGTALTNKRVTLSVEDGKLTVIESEHQSGIYPIQVGTVITNSSFSL